ncbi:MAG TPA: hypothetical protein VGQ21_18845 [Thermoanaerobaculia bacterium]|jgi:hypothetical protein|nr:hypothetical protein [Thermoanaerobaculia bacterium]
MGLHDDGGARGERQRRRRQLRHEHIQGRDGIGANFDEEAVVACDGVRFDDFVALEQRIEGLLLFRVESLTACRNERGDGAAERFRFDDDRMSADDAFAL